MHSIQSMRTGRSVCLSRAPVRKTALPKLLVRSQKEEKSDLLKKADEMGMPTYDGIFGFTPFAEQFVGRFAMLGFASSVVGEFKTGQGALGQIGIETPSTTVLIALLTIAVGATIVGTVVTGKKALDSSMSKSEASRYKNFLRLNVGEDADGEAVKMKKKGDFATPGDDLNAIAASKASGAPVDAFLSTGEVSEGDAAARDMKGEEGSSSRSSETSTQRDMYPGEANDTAFARDVEITNGRWAMLGFLASIVVEAATGKGILGQVIIYLKLSGALGDKSGF